MTHGILSILVLVELGMPHEQAAVPRVNTSRCGVDSTPQQEQVDRLVARITARRP
jgi:hypothetical protein